ncbi:MAG: D-2-hydroxyacid dehydrogenase [Gammaproteobacteria bacterium]|nr:D-2-hydroxyacid dehydrogenase [Gammaproteobacteria bacterium]
MTIRLHVKNNHAGPHTFPSTPESEPVFTITREKFALAARDFPELASRLEVFVDWDTDHWAESMADAEILLTWDLPTERLAEVAPGLKWIHCIGAGVEHLCPMDWVPEGVTITNNKGAHADKAGEYALMAVLMLHNKMPQILTNQRAANWNSLFSTPIAGKTVGLVGVGSIGGGAARQLAKMPVRILGVSRHGRPHPDVDEMYAMDALDEVLPQLDYVFVSLPSTPETIGLFDRARLERLKRGAGIINVGRGATFDYGALSALLADGHLSGAVLDVFEQEPLPPDSPLWRAPNLVVTPHVSADDGDSYVPITLQLFFDNLRRYVAGEQLRNVVRPELGY